MTKHEKKPGNPWFYWLRVCHSACHFAYIAKWQNDKLTNCHCCLFTCKECRNHFCDFTQSHRVTKSQTRKTLINQDFLHVKTALWFCDSAFCKSSSHILYNFYNTFLKLESQSHKIIRFYALVWWTIVYQHTTLPASFPRNTIPKHFHTLVWCSGGNNGGNNTRSNTTAGHARTIGRGLDYLRAKKQQRYMSLLPCYCCYFVLSGRYVSHQIVKNAIANGLFCIYCAILTRAL